LMTEYIFGNRARSNLKIRAVRMNLAGMRKRRLCYLGSRFAARVVYAMPILDGLNNLSYLIAVNSREAVEIGTNAEPARQSGLGHRFPVNPSASTQTPFSHTS
jgi:hypothetical protein